MKDPNKKPFYKRWWFILIVVLFILGSIGNALDDNKKPTKVEEKKVEKEVEKKEEKKEEPKQPEVSMEFKNALSKAKTYSDVMHMSKAGIYDQLTSEYGEGFSADAAQYAIDNLKADYKVNALLKGKSYQRDMQMSKSAVYEQLVSEYGENFTAEEAQYAIDNLPD